MMAEPTAWELKDAGIELDCDWEHGVCVCPGCGGVVHVVPRPQQSAKVCDADGREHYCRRQVATVLQRHGVGGLEAIVQRHGERAPIAKPRPRNPETLNTETRNGTRRTLDV